MVTILTRQSVIITELKSHLTQTINKSGGEPIAVLCKNKPLFYALLVEVYETIIDKLEDVELAEIVMQRQGQKRTRVNIDDSIQD